MCSLRKANDMFPRAAENVLPVSQCSWFELSYCVRQLWEKPKRKPTTFAYSIKLLRGSTFPKKDFRLKRLFPSKSSIELKFPFIRLFLRAYYYSFALFIRCEEILGNWLCMKMARILGLKKHTHTQTRTHTNTHTHTCMLTPLEYTAMFFTKLQDTTTTMTCFSLAAVDADAGGDAAATAAAILQFAPSWQNIFSRKLHGVFHVGRAQSNSSEAPVLRMNGWLLLSILSFPTLLLLSWSLSFVIRFSFVCHTELECDDFIISPLKSNVYWKLDGNLLISAKTLFSQLFELEKMWRLFLLVNNAT